MAPQDSQDNQSGHIPDMPLTPASGQATMPLPIAGSGGYIQQEMPSQPPLLPAQPIQNWVPMDQVPAVHTTAAAPSQAAAPSLQPTVPVHALSPSEMSQTDQQGVTTSTTDVAEAADGDVIETEWVAKAKQIVADTRLNPHLQVRQMNILKADYMKKRYNKDIEFPGA